MSSEIRLDGNAQSVVTEILKIVDAAVQVEAAGKKLVEGSKEQAAEERRLARVRKQLLDDTLTASERVLRKMDDFEAAIKGQAVEEEKVARVRAQLHAELMAALVEGLKGLGLMKGDTDAAVAEGAHAMFMQTGLGHMMGLDVHDMEDLGELYVGYEGQPRSTQFGLKSLRLARPIKPGFVFTVEPGVYFIPELIDRWKAEGRFRDFINYDTLETYRDFGGIRYEEDYVAGERTCRRLGKDRPKTAAEVEALR